LLTGLTKLLCNYLLDCYFPKVPLNERSLELMKDLVYVNKISSKYVRIV
jgi:hypothetical protein